MSYFKDNVPTCSECRHACYYPISFFDYRFTDPKCEVSKLSVFPDQVACENFELCGRGSR